MVKNEQGVGNLGEYLDQYRKLQTSSPSALEEVHDAISGTRENMRALLPKIDDKIAQANELQGAADKLHQRNLAETRTELENIEKGLTSAREVLLQELHRRSLDTLLSAVASIDSVEGDDRNDRMDRLIEKIQRVQQEIEGEGYTFEAFVAYLGNREDSLDRIIQAMLPKNAATESESQHAINDGDFSRRINEAMHVWQYLQRKDYTNTYGDAEHSFVEQVIDLRGLSAAQTKYIGEDWNVGELKVLAGELGNDIFRNMRGGKVTVDANRMGNRAFASKEGGTVKLRIQGNIGTHLAQGMLGGTLKGTAESIGAHAVALLGEGATAILRADTITGPVGEACAGSLTINATQFDGNVAEKLQTTGQLNIACTGDIRGNVLSGSNGTAYVACHTITGDVLPFVQGGRANVTCHTIAGNVLTYATGGSHRVICSDEKGIQGKLLEGAINANSNIAANISESLMTGAYSCTCTLQGNVEKDALSNSIKCHLTITGDVMGNLATGSNDVRVRMLKGHVKGDVGTKMKDGWIHLQIVMGNIGHQMENSKITVTWPSPPGDIGTEARDSLIVLAGSCPPLSRLGRGSHNLTIDCQDVSFLDWLICNLGGVKLRKR